MKSVDRRTAILIGLALLVHLGAFVYCCLYPEVRYLVDSYEYLQAGRNLFESGIFYAGDLQSAPLDPVLFSRRPPLYPLLLGSSTVGTGSVIPAVLLQMLMTFGGAFLLWRILRMLELPALAFVGLFLLYPAQVIYTQFLMAEVPLQFMLLSGVYCFLRFTESGKISWLIAMNGVIGLSALCKPVMMLFWLPNLLLHGWLFLRSYRPVVVLAGLIPILLFVGWGIRNERVTGYFHFTSMTASQAMLISRESRAAGERSADFAEASRKAVRAYIGNVFRRFPAYVRAYAIGMTAFYIDPGRFDVYEFLDREHQVRLPIALFQEGAQARALRTIPMPIFFLLALLLVVNGVLALGLLYFPFAREAGFLFRVFVILVLVYMTVLVGPIGTSRYRLSVEPLIIMGAAPALVRIASFSRRRWRRYREGS